MFHRYLYIFKIGQFSNYVANIGWILQKMFNANIAVATYANIWQMLLPNICLPIYTYIIANIGEIIRNIVASSLV